MQDADVSTPLEQRAAEWRSRPWLARFARALILGVPFVLVVATAWKINIEPLRKPCETPARYASQSR